MSSHCETCICGRRAPVQASWEGRNLVRGPGTIAWSEYLLAWSAYAARYGKQQSADRLADRGGFSFRELLHLLGHEPKTWEPR